MKSRSNALALFASLLMMASCTKSENGDFRSTTWLSDHLLKVTDMPKGWEETQRQVFDARGNENPSLDPSIWCSQAIETATSLQTLAGQSGADVEMSKPVGGGKGASMLRLQAWSNADVQEYFATARQAVTLCDGVTSTDENGATSTTAIIKGKAVGDESVSWSQKIQPPANTKSEKFGSIGRTTIARFGNTLMVIQVGEAAPEGSLGLMDETIWWNIVNLAANHLKK